VRKPKLRLVPTTCRRCGKPLMTGNRSLIGADAAKRRFDRVCVACTTPEDRERMDAAMMGINCR